LKEKERATAEIHKGTEATIKRALGAGKALPSRGK
jgi:hypothetical protein